MAKLEEICEHIATELRIGEIPDYPAAHNGLQLTNDSGEAGKIVAAVDACLPVIREAVEREADLLIVHHGMFWSGAQMIVGGVYERLKLAIENGLAIYSVHIPLDVHPALGNNAQLAAAIGLENPEPFFDWKGIKLGLRFELEMGREELVRRVSQATKTAAHICPGGPDPAHSVGVITGGAGAEVFAAAATGVDTFITGEGPHWSYTAAEELGVNVIYGGHYATETFGVKALSEHLSDRLGVTWEFIDHPTGL